MSQRRRYTKQFKEEALRLVSQERVSLAQMAQDLGLDASMLRRWRKEANREGSKAFRGQGYARDEEPARLKRELGRVKRERDFLRDAGLLPAPVLTAQIDSTGFFDAIIVARAPRSRKSAPWAITCEALCMTSSWDTSLYAKTTCSMLCS